MVVYLLFIIGFVVLTYGAKLLVDGGSSIGAKLKMPSIVIGMTIVAFGTSAPELLVSVFAAAKGSTDIAISNVLGSNMFNLLIIIGFTALLVPVKANHNTTWKEIPFSLLTVVVLGVFAADIFFNKSGINIISRGEGIVLLVFFLIFIYYSFDVAKKNPEDIDDLVKNKYGTFRSIIYILLGIAGLFFGGKWIVNGAILIATKMGVSEGIIALTVIAFATSLPELVTSVIAARRGDTDIALGNAIGSSIFNILLILGVASVIRPIPFAASSFVDIFILMGINILLFATIYIGHKKFTINRIEGGFLILIYIVFIIYKISLEIV